jgi:hypothetical protein
MPTSPATHMNQKLGENKPGTAFEANDLAKMLQGSA